MKLTRKEALRLHREMWSDMQKELGDNPRADKRVIFKQKWCDKHFPTTVVECDCFLCAYTFGTLGETCYDGCPISWPNGRCIKNGYYYIAPISEILALPEREG